MFNFQFGDFYGTSPNWFDWFSLLITIIINIVVVCSAFYLSEKTYKRDRKDKKNEENELVRFENELFEENLQILKNDISKQIQIFDEYIKKKDFILEIVPINVNFLNFLDVKNLYKKHHQNKDLLNSLLVSLYEISKFENSIRDEFRTFIRRYNELEAVFKDNYRIVFYDLYFEATNKRVKDFVFEGNFKKWYNKEDNFMNEYGGYVREFFKENERVADREKIKNKLKSISEMTGKYIPKDYDAIQVSHFSNKSYHAYLDMDNLIKAHFIVIRAYLDDLEKTKEKINSYLKR